MSPEWIYLLKANVGIALFYAFYKLLCQRDTFFQWRRFALLGFLGISFLYPLFNIQEWMKEQPVIYELTEYYTTLMMADDETAILASTSDDKLPILLTLCIILYFTGVAILSFRFLIQLFSILRMRWIGTPMYPNGQRIISLPTEACPFSFFGWIFLHLPQLDKDSQEEILMHEQTHVRQWHSVDILFAEIANIICWFNPFSWLLKTEVRLNLEYLADRKVTESMDDTRQYQYHLLGLAHTNRQTGLYNNFNVSHLKRRIIMMNKKRTRATGRIKYALFAPLAAALLLVSNISCTSSEKKEGQVETTAPVEQKATPEAPAQATEETQIFQIVEQMPEFPGGMAACVKWIANEVKYPTIAQENGTQGRVTIQFVVEPDGSISNPSVLHGVDPYLDKEAIRVISKMPKWTPGKQRGKAVRVAYSIPVRFQLR